LRNANLQFCERIIFNFAPTDSAVRRFGAGDFIIASLDTVWQFA